MALAVSPASAQGGGEELTISEIRFSNFTGNAFVVSWKTSLPTTDNKLLLGENKFDLNIEVGSEIEGPSQVHYAQASFLDINKIYYFKVSSDGVEKAMSPTGIDSVITSQQIRPPASVNLVGYVVDEATDDPLENVLVRSYYKWWRIIDTGTRYDSTMWLADLTRAGDGGFTFDLSNFRSYEGAIPNYIPNQTMLYLEFINSNQGVVRDSVLLTVERLQGNYQELGTYGMADETARANRGIITASSPVISNGRSASVVRVTVLDNDDKPVQNVKVELRVAPDRGVTYLQPANTTNSNGETWGLVFSTVAETKTVRALNLSSPDSTALDTFATISFVSEANADYGQDHTPPFIYYTYQHPNTQDVVGPYEITSRIVDNYTFRAKLIYTTRSNVYEDTVLMENVTGTNDYVGEIPGQQFNSVIQYLVIAEDSSGNVSSKPDSIHVNPFVLPYRFEVLSDTAAAAPKMSITRTTNALSTLNSSDPVMIETWITSTYGIRSALIKWRNRNRGDIFYDAPMQHFGSRYWGSIPAVTPGSEIEYFIQVTDSVGQVDRDRRKAPIQGLYDYGILTLATLGTVSFADTTSVLATSDIRNSHHAVLADFNDDGVPDVAVANAGEPNSLYFYTLGVGLQDVTTASFGVQRQENTSSVVAADFDGDDYLDLFFTNNGAQNRLWFNNGRGAFEDFTERLYAPTGSTYMPEEEWGSSCAVTGDFNGDGWVDIFVANTSSLISGEKNRLLFNDSLGVFRDVTDLMMINHPPDQSVWALTGDINGDNFTDIVIINRAMDHVWLRNNGKGVFAHKILTTESAAQATGGDLADVDGDGDLDLVVSQSDYQQNELFLNDGQGVFTEATGDRLPAESDNTVAAMFFDADADGHMDLYYVNYGEPNRLLINNGQGYFNEAEVGLMPAWNSYSRAAAVTDFNNDNRIDLYICEENSRNTLVQTRYASGDDGSRPSEFDLLAPGPADTVSTTSPTFVWSTSVPSDSTDVVRYDLLLSLDSLFTPGNIVQQKTGLTDTTVQVTGLADNTRYFWKVHARGRSGFTVTSRQTNGFLVDLSHQGDGPEFEVLLSRNPVFVGHITFYIISSEALLSSPTVQVNLQSLPVTRVGQNNIWRAHYVTRSSFLLTVTGRNSMGVDGEYSNAYASVLAGVGGARKVATPDGAAWLSFDDMPEARVRVLASTSEPVTSAKMKNALEELGPLVSAGAGEGLALARETESYSFSIVEGAGSSSSMRVSIRGPEGTGGELTVCVLRDGAWQELDTFFDSETGVYSAAVEQDGTFALLDTGSPAARLPSASVLALGQNSPNPFNPSTVITYTVPDHVERLTLRIYDLRGRLVRTLADGAREVGVYSIEWAGKDDRGRNLPSGVYFYRLSAAGRTMIRKMVLLR